MPNKIRPALCLLSVAVILATALPAQAVYSFGTIVDKNDFDFQPELSIRPNAGGATTKIFLPCFIDIDGNGHMESDEAAYIAVTTGVPGICGSVSGKYIRLKQVGPYGPGSEVKGDVDSDVFRGLVQLGTPGVPAHALRAFKVDPAVALKKADTLYLDINNLGALIVDPGDMRLSAFGALKAGTVVKVGDADQSMPLTELHGGVTKSFYTASVVYEFGKAWYINADMDAATKGVEEGDVRLTATVPNLQGDIMAGIGNPGKIVENIMVTPDIARPGQKVEVVITVKNISTKVGSALVETVVDGKVVDARGTPTLVKDEVAKLLLNIEAPSEVGRHKIQAGDVVFFLDVEGTPVAGAGASSAEVAALNARIQALESRLTQSAAAPVQVKDATVQTQGAAGPSPIVVFAAVALALAVLLRRRNA